MQQLIWPRARSVIGLIRLALGMIAACTLTATSPAHAAKWFVDNALGDVKAEEKVQPATPKPEGGDRQGKKGWLPSGTRLWPFRWRRGD